MTPGTIVDFSVLVFVQGYLRLGGESASANVFLGIVFLFERGPCGTYWFGSLSATGQLSRELFKEVGNEFVPQTARSQKAENWWSKFETS